MLHTHVVPIHKKSDITSRRYIAEDAITFRDMPRATDRELADTASKLSHFIGDAAFRMIAR